MANLFDFLVFLQKTPLPYILVVLGLIVTLVSLREAIAWRIDVAPETLRIFLPDADYRVYTFVRPVEADRTLVIQAVLVGNDATFNGTPLADLPPNFYLGPVHDV